MRRAVLWAVLPALLIVVGASILLYRHGRPIQVRRSDIVSVHIAPKPEGPPGPVLKRTPDEPGSVSISLIAGSIPIPLPIRRGSSVARPEGRSKSTSRMDAQSTTDRAVAPNRSITSGRSCSTSSRAVAAARTAAREANRARRHRPPCLPGRTHQPMLRGEASWSALDGLRGREMSAEGPSLVAKAWGLEVASSASVRRVQGPASRYRSR